MIIYVIAVAFSMICAAYANNVKNIKSLNNTYKILCVLAFLPTTLVSVLRFEVGTDWSIYDDYFHWISEGKDKFSEPLFNLLNRIIYLFTKDSWLLFAVCAVIIGYFTYRAIMEQSVNPAFSILIFMISGDYFNSQNQIRQAIAMAIFLYAMKYMKSRDWKRYYFAMIIALMIHTSAIIYFPLYFLYGKKVNVRLLIGIFCATVVCLPVMKKVIVFVLTKTKYGWYFDSVYNTNDFYLLGFLFTVFFNVILFFYYCYGEKYALEKGKTRDEIQDYDFNIMMYTYYFAGVSVLFSAVVPQMVRITTGFSIVTSLLMPRLMVREHKRNRRIVLYMLGVAVFMVKFVYDVYHNGWYDALPYQSVFTR